MAHSCQGICVTCVLCAGQASIKDELGSEEEQAIILLELGRLTEAEQIYR